MPRRSLLDARRTLDEQRPYISDSTLRRYSEHLDRHDEDARHAAERHVAGQADDIRDTFDTALRELTTARDAYDDLAAQAGQARIGSRDYAMQLRAARARHEKAEGALETLEARVDALAAVEEDPIAWHDGLAQRMPELRIEVPW